MRKGRSRNFTLFYIFAIMGIGIFLHDYNFSNDIKSPINSYFNSNFHLTQSGTIENGSRHLFWFIHITDTQDCWVDAEKTQAFNRFLNETFSTIRPKYIINTGDLVNTDHEDFWARNDGQWDLEWLAYNNTLNQTGMNTSVYIDLMGNHDVYGDPKFSYYYNYSLLGSSKGVTQYSWNYSNPSGKFAFIGLHTPDNDGVEYPFALFGAMNQVELDWYEKQLQAYNDAEIIFTFGHHPLYDTLSGLSSSGNNLLQLHDKYGVDAYFYGHNHMNLNEYYPELGGIRAIQTTMFSDNRGSYRIVAVDGTGISSEVGSVGEWPQGIITNPPAGDHLYQDYDNDLLTEINSIRVLAWDPTGVVNVRIRVGDGSWINATHIEGPLWEAPYILSQFPQNEQIYAEISGNSGNITLNEPLNQIPSITWNQFYTIMLILGGIIALVSFFTILYLKQRFKRFKLQSKDKEKNVDKNSFKFIIMKCLIFLLVPLTNGFMLTGSNGITLLFGPFLVSLAPFKVYTNALFLLVMVVVVSVTILPQSLNLARRKTKGLILASITSITLEIAIQAFFIPRYSTSWMGPGFHLLVLVDVWLIIYAMKRKRNFTQTQKKMVMNG